MRRQPSARPAAAAETGSARTGYETGLRSPGSTRTGALAGAMPGVVAKVSSYAPTPAGPSPQSYGAMATISGNFRGGRIRSRASRSCGIRPLPREAAGSAILASRPLGIEPPSFRPPDEVRRSAATARRRAIAAARPWHCPAVTETRGGMQPSRRARQRRQLREDRGDVERPRWSGRSAVHSRDLANLLRQRSPPPRSNLSQVKPCRADLRLCGTQHLTWVA